MSSVATNSVPLEQALFLFSIINHLLAYYHQQKGHQASDIIMAGW